MHGARGVLELGRLHFAFDAQVVAHHAHVTEGHAGLHHAERPRVHTHQQHAAALSAIALEVGLVRRARVDERVVDVRRGSGKAQLSKLLGELLADLGERRVGHATTPAYHGERLSCRSTWPYLPGERTI